MNALLLSILLSTSGPMLLVPNASGLTSYGASGISCFHDSDNSVSLCVYTSDTSVTGIAPPNKTTDANSGNLTVHAENVLASAAAARTAGNLVLAGGLDSKKIVFDDANPSGDADCTGGGGATVTVTVNGTALAAQNFNTFCGAACTSKALACTALASALDALSGISAVCGTDGDAVASTVAVSADQPATVSIYLTESATGCTTVSNGTDGCIAIGNAYIKNTSGTAGALELSASCGGAGSQFAAGAIYGTSINVTTVANATLATADITGFDDWYDSAAMTSDAAPTPVHTITGKPPYNGTSSTHTEGSSIVLAPASGLQLLTGVTKAGTAGDTLTFTSQDMEGASASVVLTEGAGAGQWNCNGAASDAECVCNIYTLVTTHATLGSRVTVTRTDGTCSDEKLAFNITPGTTSRLYVAQSDTTNETMTRGTDGCVKVGDYYIKGTSSGTTIGNDSCGGVAGYLQINNIQANTQVSSQNFYQYPSSGDGTKGLTLVTPYGGSTKFVQNGVTVTFSGGAGDASKTATGIIPLGAQNVSIKGRVKTSGTTCTSFSVGNTGAADPDMYAATVPPTADQTFGPTVASYGPTAQPLGTQITAAGDVVLTANGGNCVSLVVYLEASYSLTVAPTSAP